MIAADSSVAVPGALPWHDAYPAVDAALSADRVALPAHAAIETYSVLTRLPEPLRLPPAGVLRYLRVGFAGEMLMLSARGHRRLLERAATEPILGGAIYDAVVAATALEAGATLLTRDRRAARVYRVVGVEFETVD